MLVFWGSFAYDMYADRFLICGGGKEEPVLKKMSVCVLFGGVSSEHEVSLRSAESVLNRLDKDKYHIFPVGITKDGDWIPVRRQGLRHAARRNVAELRG